MEDQPTVEQSLHSIALSLIGIHKELKDTRRIHHNTLRLMKQKARQPIVRVAPRKPTVWDWLRQLVGARPSLGGGTGPF